MSRERTIGVPTLVRLKPGALDRLGLYLARAGHRRPVLVASAGMLAELRGSAEASLSAAEVAPVATLEIDDGSFERCVEAFAALPVGCDAVVGLGGGRALDAAKYVAFLAALPYHAVPTSLSNDGFCSPGASLTIGGARRSLRSALPYGVVVDTEVCRRAPIALWHSGVGDLVAKITAVHDWKLDFHVNGAPVDDLAALLSDATVMQFAANPARDAEGTRLLATALMLNGISMEIAGSSRPASGSEHLISHAHDRLSPGTHLHGVQVGFAAYLMSHLQGQGTELVGAILDRTGFFDTVRARPFDRATWLRAVQEAPELVPGRFTVLSDPDRGADAVVRVGRLLDEDPRLAGCVVG